MKIKFFDVFSFKPKVLLFYFVVTMWFFFTYYLGDYFNLIGSSVPRMFLFWFVSYYVGDSVFWYLINPKR